MSKVLKGLDQIRNYINPDNQIGRETVLEFISRGMPVRIIGSVYYAHADNIDAWFKQYTTFDIHEDDQSGNYFLTNRKK